ncbi:Fe-S cluster assembly protein SufD [Limimaricola soesokkakensis]|uniref:Fe-S cluster assembly protein SufD n=1 Tax=Limimaricola soesokkakensis TaxID=1343159 RepID=A0A1X6ZV97_9RHOB|nr:Fe-S cluster assembly protein SufD [Limimaricola soesokkakensis]PSK82899.1 Fe-S cluster assembly protein SufD [Limimaricola soesokkakensis]SLN60808.1 FeS cluster assembly protein SufD [Limimaricola soesokkakensis]
MALAQAKSDATEARLSGMQIPEGGAGWARAARQDALDRLTGMGLPQRRDEYWRFTNPAEFLKPETPRAEIALDAPGFDDTDVLRVVFTDGVFDAEASDALSQEGLEIERFADAVTKHIHWIKGLLGVLETAGQDRVDRPFATFNTAFAEDGVVLRATGKVSKPVHVEYRRSDDTAEAVLRHMVRVEDGAELTLLESGVGASRLNTGLEVDIADRGVFHHVRMQGRDHERRAATHVFARLGEESTFKSFTLSLNGMMTRNEVIITLKGDDAVAHVAGAALGDGRDFHHDDTVFITHDAVNCESRQVFKKVLRNGATGVFQGKILVQPDAQKTDGYQISQSLLLDEDANFLAKPELEIYADDVQCSHGSTSGAIDETALFYLKSRGIPEDKAQDLLVLAFVAEALAEIEDEDLAETLRTQLAGWLERRR